MGFESWHLRRISAACDFHVWRREDERAKAGGEHGRLTSIWCLAGIEGPRDVQGGSKDRLRLDGNDGARFGGCQDSKAGRASPANSVFDPIKQRCRGSEPASRPLSLGSPPPPIFVRRRSVVTLQASNGSTLICRRENEDRMFYSKFIPPRSKRSERPKQVRFRSCNLHSSSYACGLSGAHGRLLAHLRSNPCSLLLQYLDEEGTSCDSIRVVQ